jgi:hypothetical protein
MPELGGTSGDQHHLQIAPGVFVDTRVDTTTAPKGKKRIHKPGPVDTMTSAGGTQGSGSGIQVHVAMYAGIPVLVLPNSEGMSSADMIALVAGALDKHRARQMQQSVKLNPADVPNLLTETITVQQQSTSQGNQPAPPQNAQTTTYTILVVENSPLGKIADTLGHDIFQSLRKHFKGRHLPMTLNQVEAFLQQVLTSGVLFSALPTLSLLQMPTHPPSFLTADGAVNAASAATLINLIAQSGPEFENFANTLFPDDPDLAAALGRATTAAMTHLALNDLGGTLSLPGLATQVEAQANLVRTENEVVNSPNFKNSEVPKLIDFVLGNTTGRNRPEVRVIVNRVLEEVASKGPFNTRQELLTALTESFKRAFPGQPQLAEGLATQTEQDALEAALASSGAVYAPQFDPSKLNVTTIDDSVTTTILREFADSDQAIRARATAEAVAYAIEQGVKRGELTSEQAVRTLIKNSLINEGFEPVVADRVAAQVDLGLPESGPLQDTTDNSVLPPQAYGAAISNAVWTQLHIDPKAPLGQAVLNTLGVSDSNRPVDNPHSTDMIGLINLAYRDDQNKGVNFLYLEGSDQAIAQGLAFLDPGRKLVIEWSLILRGTADKENFTRTANQNV